jgi:C4-dicarboxylate transporter DctM subunit
VLFIIVIGGLLIGVFTPTEAGSLGAFGAFVIAVIKRRITRMTLIDSLKTAAHVTCFTMTLVIGAMIFSTFLLFTGLPNALSNFIVGLPLPPVGIVIAMLVAYIPLGMVMDGLPVLLITTPVFLPALTKLDINLIWFGVLVILMCQISMLSPPVGINAYIVQGMTNVPLEKIFRGLVPFILTMCLTVVVLILFPQMSLFLTHFM